MIRKILQTTSYILSIASAFMVGWNIAEANVIGILLFAISCVTFYGIHLITKHKLQP